MSNIKGIVVSPPIRIKKNSLYLESSNLDPQELRCSLLFWDKIDFPTNNIIQLGSNAEVDFLENENILKRTRTIVNQSGDVANLYLRAHLETFRTLNESEPGVWSLGTGENSISFPKRVVKEENGAIVSLFGAIPVPNVDVALADILEFKNRRQAELHALRHELDVLYQGIADSEDSEEALKTAINKVQAAVIDQQKASKEFPITWRWSNISAKLNVAGGVIGGAAGALVGQQIGFPEIFATGAAIAQGIKIDIGGSLEWSTPTKGPYQYVSSFHREVFNK